MNEKLKPDEEPWTDPDDAPEWTEDHFRRAAIYVGGKLVRPADGTWTHQLAATGAYARVRHPQYIGFIMIMAGFLFQWPTLITLVMFPVLVFMYVRLARREEQDARAEFGEAYSHYEANTPAFFPKFGVKSHA